MAVGDSELTLAPLTFGQVEELLSGELAAEELRWMPIAWAIANGGGRADLAGLKQQVCLEEYLQLFQNVLELTGLKRRKDRPDDGPPVDFGYLRSRMAALCGWTFEECERAPFPYVMRLFEYWNEFPPVDLLFQGFVGYQSRDIAAHNESSQAEKEMFVSMWGGQVRDAKDLPPFLQAAIADLKKNNKPN